jgi:hypothetical protein
MSGLLKSDGTLVFAQAALTKKLFETESQRLAVSIPPVDRESAHVDAIASAELHGV